MRNFDREADNDWMCRWKTVKSLDMDFFNMGQHLLVNEEVW